ncbi:MAG: restriction endonuclease subunit S [Brevibacterium aurantiacum]|uniref:restriction endonuclease subunit S n=1 Tax=Corynebacterium variabile TaxID=1727 RepID=UPI003F9A2DF0
MSEWRDSPLGKVATLQRGFDLPARSRRPGKVPIVSSSGVSGWHDRAMVKAPGVVTGRYGTIGEVFYEENDFWPLNTTLWVSNYHGNDQRFVYYLLQRIDYAMHSGKSGVPGVNRNDLHGELVHVPVSVAEQQSISAILKDVDALVSTLERLIAKKRAIKQGMMQELLTGRTRLPGFVGPWRDTTFGDVVRIQRGSILTRAQAGQGDVPVIAGGKTPAGYTDKPNRTGRTLTISASGASAGYVALHSGPIFASDCSTISGASHYDLDFIYYSLLLRQDEIYRAQTGGAQPHIHARDVYPIELQVPADVEQQVVIGSALRDADAEIDALERQLDATRDIKQGMMQELLTGRTRLPVDEEMTV